jgi:maleylacetate reductase
MATWPNHLRLIFNNTMNNSVLQQFSYDSYATRIHFAMPAIPMLGQEVDRLGKNKVLIVCMPDTRSVSEAEEIERHLGSRAVGLFTEAKVHVPIEILNNCISVAKSSETDLIVSVGGGSSIGLAKLVADELKIFSIALPTTYSGAEMTPFNAVTENGEKLQRRSDSMVPKVVIYDIERSLNLPLLISYTSSMNALAHSIEALYAPNKNILNTQYAWGSIEAILKALPLLETSPREHNARANLMLGSMLGGMALAGASMGLHHKLCHLLGGLYDVGHAELNSVILPYAMAYNFKELAHIDQRIASYLGAPTEKSSSLLFKLQQRLSCPIGLKAINIPEIDIETVARQLLSKSFPNPSPLSTVRLQQMLQDAYLGNPPRNY